MKWPNKPGNLLQMNIIDELCWHIAFLE